MAGNYFGFAAPGGPYGSQTAYTTAEHAAAVVAAGQAFAAATTNPRPAYQAYDAVGQQAPSFAYSSRPAVVTVAIGPQYHAQGIGTSVYSAAQYGQQRQQQQQGTAAKPGFSTAAAAAAAAHHRVAPALGGSGGRQQPRRPAGQSAPTAAAAAAAAAKPKEGGPPPSQLHFCDLCKIGCLGPQTYREHLEGQRHKRKEAALAATSPATNNCPTEVRCELCTVTCTGAEAYADHVRGSKHQRVLKLYAKLGKPVPELATAAGSQPEASAASSSAAAAAATVLGKPQACAVPAAVLGKPLTSAAPPAAVAATSVASTVKENASAHSGSGSTGCLKTSSAVPARIGSTVEAANTGDKSSDTDGISETTAVNARGSSNHSDGSNPATDRLIGAVGLEYVEELASESGKVVVFHCKLCNCKVNDPSAKELHVKGKRHRLQYKKKVDPNFDVDGTRATASKRRLLVQQRQPAERLRTAPGLESVELRRVVFPADDLDDVDEGERGYFHVRSYSADFLPGQAPYATARWPAATADDDSLVTALHDEVYPTEEELLAVQAFVMDCETALRLVSDHLAAAAPAATTAASLTKESAAARPAAAGCSGKEERVLKSLQRVGALAKGLLLAGSLDFELVLLCSTWPTRQLLEQVAQLLPSKLQEVSDEQYEIMALGELGAVRVSRLSLPAITCVIKLTSPLVRQTVGDTDSNELAAAEPPDAALDRHSCLAALAALRRAKWFEAKAAPLPSCVALLRILKVMRTNFAALAAINEWARICDVVALQALELLVEHCVRLVQAPLCLCDSLRLVCECLASGVLLPGGPGLLDPCEKEPVDAAEPLSVQQRDDLTAFAQKCLRMIAFGQLRQLLGAADAVDEGGAGEPDARSKKRKLQ